MPDAYVIRDRRWQSLIGVAVGGLVLLFGLGIHFGYVPSKDVGPNHPIWIGASVIGCLIIAAALKTTFSPRTLLVADEKGITLFSGGTDQVWNPATKSFDTTRRKGDSILLPWDRVVEIGEGVVGTSTQRRGPAIEVLGGKTSLGGRVPGSRTTQSTAKALKVLCDPSLKPEGFDMVGISQAWNGLVEADLRAMSKAEREKVPRDDLYSGFLFRSLCLPGTLNSTVAEFKAMREKFGQPTSPGDIPKAAPEK